MIEGEYRVIRPLFAVGGAWPFESERGTYETFTACPQTFMGAQSYAQLIANQTKTSVALALLLDGVIECPILRVNPK